jgi:hypothetical protein
MEQPETAEAVDTADKEDDDYEDLYPGDYTNVILTGLISLNKNLLIFCEKSGPQRHYSVNKWL